MTSNTYCVTEFSIARDVTRSHYCLCDIRYDIYLPQLGFQQGTVQSVTSVSFISNDVIISALCPSTDIWHSRIIMQSWHVNDSIWLGIWSICGQLWCNEHWNSTERWRMMKLDIQARFNLERILLQKLVVCPDTQKFKGIFVWCRIFVTMSTLTLSLILYLNQMNLVHTLTT